MGSFYGTGAVYFLWPVLILTLMFEYIWCALSLFLSFKIGMLQRTALSALKRHLFTVFVTSFGCNAALTVVLYILYFVSEVHPSLAEALNAPFIGINGTLTALFVILLILLTGMLKYILYQRIVFRMQSVEEIRKCVVFLAILTTPWLYLLPTQTAYGLLGSIMMAIGSLTPGELPTGLLLE